MNYIFQMTLPHPMRRVSLALLLLSSALSGIAQDAAKDNKEQLTVVLSEPNKPGSLEVELVNGFVHVSGYGGKSVVIDAVARPRSGSESREERLNKATPPGMKRLSPASGLNLSAEEKNNTVKISTDSYLRPIDLTIKVPLNFSLKLGTINDGDILVENVHGELEVSNVSGAIRLSQVAGSAVANTVNGPLTATFKSVTPGAPMAFSTLGGKLDVTLPTATKAALKLKSDRGQVYSDFDVAVDKSPAKATRTTQNGLYRLSTDDWTYGNLNGGGAQVRMQSMTGDIFLRKAK